MPPHEAFDEDEEACCSMHVMSEVQYSARAETESRSCEHEQAANDDEGITKSKANNNRQNKDTSALSNNARGMLPSSSACSSSSSCASVENDTTIRPLNECVGVKYFSDWEGYGCVALQNIPKHTLIHMETPILRGNQCAVALAKHRSGEHRCKEDDVKYLMDECRLTEKEIDGLWALHDQYEGRYSGVHEMSDASPGCDSKRLFGLIYSNVFQNVENGHAYRLYRNAARFNHSCSPNVGYDFDDWTIRMYTTREVRAGDTLCTCYSDVVYHFGRVKRRAYLKGALKFDCACSSCHPEHMPCDDGGASELEVKNIEHIGDERRKRLKEIAVELKARLGDACPLYDAVFNISVNEFYKSQNAPASGTGADTATQVDIERRREQLREKARLRKLSREIPIGEYDLNLLHEYLDLLEKEGIDHDLLPVYEMAYDVAAGVHCPSKHEWAEKCLNLYLLAKGADHPKTRAFNEKMKG